MADEATIRALERLIIRSGTITSKAFEQVHPEVRKLTVHQYRLFALVATSPDGLRVVELARRSLSRPQATTRMVQRLEAKGLVEYERGALADRRAVVVRVTDVGRRIWAEISTRRRELLGEALAGLEPSPEGGATIEAIAGAFERYIA